MPESLSSFPALLGPSGKAPGKGGKRILTVFLPGFGLQVAVLHRPELKAFPLAREGDPPHVGRVVECSRSAAASGVHEGQTLARARLACPDIHLLTSDADELAMARRDICEALSWVGPLVSWGGGGNFHLEVTGLAKVHGGERSLLAHACEAVQRLGFLARAGCADSRFVSQIAARARAGICLVPVGEAASFLAGQPLSCLPLGKTLTERLSLLGLHTIEDFMRLPSDGLADRFGPAAARCQRLARGEEEEPFVAFTDLSGPSATRELDEPIEGLEPVTFLLKSCCEELAEKLAARGNAASRVELALSMERVEASRRLLAPSRPMFEARALLDLCRLELEARPVAAPLIGVGVLAAEEQPVRAASAQLFRRAPDLSALAAAVDRMRVLMGQERVSTPAPQEAWRREARVGWMPFESGDLQASDPAKGVGLGDHGAERILPQPLAVHVHLPSSRSSDEGGLGSLEISSRAERKAHGLPARVEVRARLGPHRISGEWWDGGARIFRDEYLLLCEDGGLYRVCRDRRTKKWSLLGFVD